MSTQNLKEKVLHSLADETLVDLETTFQKAHIQEVIDQLDSELVGLKSVKTRVKEIATLLLSSRIAHRIDFPDYTIDELLAIARIILEAQHYRFSSDAETAFRDYLAQTSMPDFANARSVRNALEQARMRQANRLLARGGERVTKQDLMTIKAEDILASRVFKESIPDCVVA